MITSSDAVFFRDINQRSQANFNQEDTVRKRTNGRADDEPTNRWPRTLGSNFRDKANEVVLAFGNGGNRVEFTRLEMAEQLGCVDFIAARDYVTPVLEDMGVDSVEMIYGINSSRFYMRTVPGTGIRGVRIRRLGIVSMNVLMALIKHKHRGHPNPERWVAGMSNDIVTLATHIRRQELKVKERKAKNRRKKR